MYLQLMLLAMLIVPQQKSVPVQSPSGTHSTSYVCNFAKVKDHLEQRSYVLVLSGPGARFRKIDRLRSGREVYICDERGDWFKIFYSKPEGPCGPKFSNGLDVQRASDCQSGWVERKWVNVISG
jgi:hypothetical protein